MWRGKIAYMLKLAHLSEDATIPGTCHTGLHETLRNASIDNEQSNICYSLAIGLFLERSRLE